ncbi:hypothetical protein B0H11DRAFT_1985076 [Mycena galericulata]|nr:hypothetical protein B0H11DRAFT_1985076 [Mycena galericulata]
MFTCVSLPYSTTRNETCPFCHVSATNGFTIIWEDEIFVAFRDRSPASEHHIQLITKRHIGAWQCTQISRGPIPASSECKIPAKTRCRTWFVRL